MHPVLVEVPWPELGLPVWPAFVLLAIGGAVLGVAAARRKSRSAAVLGAVLAVAALTLAITSRGSRFSAGPFEVRAWGVLFAGALFAGSLVAIRRGVARGVERELVARACIAASVGGVIGARLVWVLLHPVATGSVEGTVAFYQGGLSVWGGLVGGISGAALSANRSGAPLFALLDLAAPSLGVGVALTRLGCFLEGCDFGVPLGKSAPRFIAALGTFPKDSPAWSSHVLSRGLSPTAVTSLPVHPTELYEVAGGAALVALALALGRRKLPPGAVFAAAVLGYLLLRVSLDSLRDDSAEMWVSRALLLLVILGTGAVVTFSHFRSRAK